ncbi:MAG TPA: barstar family protein [Planctomycetota bacterium]|nr:barstar family protein [Planctomycetota bacterium]
MKRFVLDGDAFDGLPAFYDHAGDVLCPGFAWGRNLDAFKDILYGGFGVFEDSEEIELVWKNSAKSKQDLGHRETAWWLEETLDRIHPTNRERWMERLAAARSGRGPTLYDELVEIIRHHQTILFREE